MNLFAHSIASKGGLAFARRVGTIAQRFDVSPARVEGYLNEYLVTLGQFGANATFPITAVVLQRHPETIRRLAAAGVEFAVHGYIHTDHALLSAEEQYRQFSQALKVFAAERISVSGFRGPYLRYNNATVAVVEELGFDYISNETYAFDVVDLKAFPKIARDGFARAMRLYSARPASDSVVRPRMRGRLVEIPVSMPDDEILVDRLGIESGSEMGKAWTRLLDLACQRGDIVTLQLHPERGEICREGLATVLRAARNKYPAVWLAQLRDVAAWWKRRIGFQLQVDPDGPGRWRVSTKADPDATVWARNVTGATLTPWYGPFATIDQTVATVEATSRPIIGVSRRSEDARRFLIEEGYAVAVVPDSTDCSLFIDRPSTLTPSDQARLLAEVQDANVPLVGIGRWPNRARAAMAVTGDIDALTLIDFFMRIWEVR